MNLPDFIRKGSDMTATHAPEHDLFHLASPTLGFGLMRLPKIGGTLQDAIDVPAAQELIDRFVAEGGWYFDTAWAYDSGNSERTLKTCVVDRYPRESYWVTDKLPLASLKKPDDLAERFQMSLERTGLEYFDLYLAHNVVKQRAELADELGVWPFMRQLKADGRIRNIGFSFHDRAELLDELLTEHPEIDVVQLQLNYADWDDPVVQSRACYEVARRHGVPIIVMEPLKGGALTTIDAEYAAPLKAARPDDSLAAWAFRFLATQPGIVAILSGMNRMEQMADNTAIFRNLEPLSPAEQEIVSGVAARLAEIPLLGCTKCRYCVDGCPEGLMIPELIDDRNSFYRFGSADSVRHFYRVHVRGRSVPADCIGCGACEAVCPQHLPIIQAMDELAQVFGPEHLG